MISYRGDEAIDWFGFSLLWSQTVGYAVTTSRIDSLNRRKTLSESFASARLLFCYKGDDVYGKQWSRITVWCCSWVERTNRILLCFYIFLQTATVHNLSIISNRNEVYKLEYIEMEYIDNNDYKFEFYDGKVLTIRWDNDILTKENETAGRK